MKRFTFAIVLFLLIGLSYSCDEKMVDSGDFEPYVKSDLEEMGFYGNIESIVETECEFTSSDGEVYDVEVESEVLYKFNTNGNITERWVYGSDGRLRFYEMISYDDKGNKKSHREYDSYDKLKEEVVFSYDDKGNKIEECIYNSYRELNAKIIYLYDMQGNIIEKLKYGSKGKLKEKYVYIYDKDGNLVDESLYDSNGALQHNYIYTDKIEYRFYYDNQGDMYNNTRYIYNDKSHLQERWERTYYKGRYNVSTSLICKYTYDDKDRIIEDYAYDTDGDIIFQKECTYDDRGNIIKEYLNDKGCEFITTYIYDNIGKLIEENVTGRLGNGKTTYAYDEKGNKIEEKSYKINNAVEKPIHLIQNEITYR